MLAHFEHHAVNLQLFNGATIGECVYNLVEGRDLPVTLKPFPAYSEAVGKHEDAFACLSHNY